MINVISIEVVDFLKNSSRRRFTISVDQDLLGDWHVNTCTRKPARSRGLRRHYLLRGEQNAQSQVRELLLKRLSRPKGQYAQISEIDAYDHINILNWVPTDQIPLRYFI